MRPKHALIIVIGLGAALALTPAARPQDGRGPFDGLQAHYWPHRKLGIPVGVEKLGGLENKPTHLQLYYSLKRGPFQKGPKLPIDRLDEIDSGKKGIIFEAPRDGDYEFTVQHVYADGKVKPATDALAPELRIIVDTTAPRVQIAPSGNGVEWSATDENIDPAGVTVQCKWPATNEWTNVKNVVDRPFSTSGTYGWKFKSGEALDVRVKARDRAGHEGVSPVVRVPAESGTPVGLPKGPAWGGDPAPPMPESRIDYVNTLDFNFDYTVQHMGRSGVRAAHLFVQKDRSPWEFVKKQPENLMPGGKEPHLITLSYNAPNEGIYGFYIIPESGAGKKADDPKKDEPPMMLVVVDTTKPQVEITSVQVKPGGVKGPIVEITWRATDSNLMPRPVNLEWSSDREATKWNEIKYRLDNDLTATTGRYAWEVPDEKLWKFYVRARAVDKAANAGESVWGQEVIVDLEKPSGTIDRVRGGGGAGTPAPKSDTPAGTPAPKSPSPGKPVDKLLP